MKPTEITKLFARLGYIRTVAFPLALSTVMLGIGLSARTATIHRPKEPLETRRILSGIVSDSMCGQGHTINGHGDRECTRICVKLGAKYALVASRSLFILKGHEAELDEYAGEKVIVAGAVNGDTIRVESVAPLDLVHGAASFE
ncbi:MAG: hypothetical protein DMG49_15790 [Acidobacteria bacterium]|nr:MAG: hypothetical protein DMG49_15790 [Acidobacteriota bacterium]